MVRAWRTLLEMWIRDMEQKGLLEDGEDFVKLTDRGIDVSNYVMSEFLL